MEHLHACCVCKKRLPDRKKLIPLFGQTGKAKDIRKGLVLYFEEEIREDVSDQREAFASDSYMCLDCAKLIEEFPKLRERWQYAVTFLRANVAPIASLSARSPVRVRPPIPLAMSTPKRPRLDTGIQQSLPVQVRIARN